MRNTLSANTIYYPRQEIYNNHPLTDHVLTLTSRMEILTERVEAIGGRVEAVYFINNHHFIGSKIEYFLVLA